jgi:hypothetical protein
MGVVFLAIDRPLRFPNASSLNSNLESTSDPMMNRKGERGSPCLRPLFGENKPKGLALMRMEKEEEEMHNLIQLIHEE